MGGSYNMCGWDKLIDKKNTHRSGEIEKYIIDYIKLP